ncbi:cellulose biosynthesis cyclic di-GMP-binding regulatory protein BcsB [Oculatella sp. LEGE 06141]|uniref:cellulose biosynthesis cyclic di-GMP-binding regulatory protein BcsB n=1 Tax=Oculatella sp. LEGE 06141 TaxID=1828648 RepID=UPI001882F48A|nr:cellulose biosynthesis cyclic di-GMP-binding regulatory protein BcsB [Oculatella sp. LEGE 06141]MBE9182396.1 cellulose biosynthesis cyclic di-GMP-binding regulatory protein BcsB [Oculatella sp. LEGE 06141]
MVRFLYHRLFTWFHRNRVASADPRTPHRRGRSRSLIGLVCLLCLGVGIGLIPIVAHAQESDRVQPAAPMARDITLPRSSQRPVYQSPVRTVAGDSRSPQIVAQAAPTPAQSPASQTESAPASPAETAETTGTTEAAETPASEYSLEFNRSPIVGSRLRLQGVYPETRLGFSRPRDWEVTAAKALIRFQHSPSLLGDRSNLTVRVNDTSIGSVPLNREQSQVGQVLFNIPPTLLQDFNDISLLAEQQTSETCTHPSDPTLWTEILPDSKLIFNYQPQPIALDFSRYPYPFIDSLSLEPNQLAYLRPGRYSETWLTAASRFQTSAGRLADFHPLNTRLVTTVNEVNPDERLIVIGTPAEQPALANLILPLPLRNGVLVDGNGSPLPNDVGALMLTTANDGTVPVLVASGNSAEGVLKAVQFLVQSQTSQIGTGDAIAVTTLSDTPSPSPRTWSGYLPVEDTFQLSSLTTANREPFQDVTVYGTNAPGIQVPFRALPDDRFMRGSRMTVHYSYSSQIDPRTSAIEVKLDGVAIGSKQLSYRQGGRESFDLNLPADLIQPNSVLSVQFVLHPRVPGACGLVVDHQLWGTLHTDTRFNLKRANVVNVPNLQLLQTGYPLTAPQDLSAAAVVVPDSPNDEEVSTLLALGERMGRLSRAESVKLQVYQAGTIPADIRNERNLVGIGTRDRFPFPEVLQDSGLQLASFDVRQWQQSQIQTSPDTEGVVKEVVSPWNRDRQVLALTGQSEQGLREVQALFKRDPLFSQLRGDTVLISRNQQNPSPYDASGYTLQVLQQSPQRQIERTGFFNRITLYLQDHWYVLPIGIVLLGILLYGISQLYLNRIDVSGGSR